MALMRLLTKSTFGLFEFSQALVPVCTIMYNKPFNVTARFNNNQQLFSLLVYRNNILSIMYMSDIFHPTFLHTQAVCSLYRL